MVDPLSDEDRRLGNRRLAAGFAAVVAISAGLTAYRSGATAAEAVAVAIAGVFLGVVLLAIIA